MRKEAASHLTLDYNTADPYTYEEVGNIQDITQRLHQITTMCSKQCALVTTTLHFEYEGKGHLERTQQRAKSVHYLLSNLRTLIRKGDTALLLRHTFYFILVGANLQGGGIVQERLWEALLWRVHSANDIDLVQPRSMEIGHSAFPLPYREIGQCITAARETQKSIDLYPEKSARKPAPTSTQSQTSTDELPALARRLGIPYLTLLPHKLPTNVQQLVSRQLAQELHCYPVGRARDILTVAMSNPQDHHALARLRQETGLRIFPVLAHPQELQTAIEQLH